MQVDCNGSQRRLPIERVVGKYHVDVDREPRHVLHKEIERRPSLQRDDRNTAGAIASSKRTVSTYS